MLRNELSRWVWAVALLGAFTVSPAGAALETAPVVRWVVTLPDTHPGAVHVRAELPSQLLTARSQVELRFLDRLGTPSRLLSFRARAENSELPTIAPGENTRIIEIVDPSKTVVIQYSIIPTYPYGSPNQQDSDARSRVTSVLAVLRTTSVFAKLDFSAEAHVRFSLPPGWVTVAPWKTDGDGFVVTPAEQSAVEYIGLGPFDVREIGAEGRIRVGAAQGQTGPPIETIASIVEREASFFGSASVPAGSLVIVPASFMRGGASGSHSAVQGPQPDTIAHEVFHWWNSGAVTLEESGWFREGLTTFYGLRFAKDSGAYTDEQMQSCLADLNAEMRFLETDHPVSLADASTKWRDRPMERLMYSKGTLFTMLLSKQLAEKGRNLDEVVRIVLTNHRQRLTNTDLKQLFRSAFGDSLDVSFGNYVENATRLPDLGIGAAATGRSGCAYFRPSK